MSELRNPGPPCTAATPGAPVILPSASAIDTATCSWRVDTYLIPLSFDAFTKSRIVVPMRP